MPALASLAPSVVCICILTSDVPISFQLAHKAVVPNAIFPIAATDNPSTYKSGFPTTPISTRSVPDQLNAT